MFRLHSEMPVQVWIHQPHVAFRKTAKRMLRFQSCFPQVKEFEQFEDRVRLEVYFDSFKPLVFEGAFRVIYPNGYSNTPEAFLLGNRDIEYTLRQELQRRKMPFSETHFVWKLWCPPA